MSDWAAQAAKELWKHEAEQKHEDAVYIQKRTHILSDAPRLWEVLKETLFSEINAFNEHRPDYFKMSANFRELAAISIESEKAKLDARFDEAIPTVRFSTTHQTSPASASTIQGSYDFEIQRGTVWYSSQRAVDVDTVAHEMLDTMLRRR